MRWRASKSSRRAGAPAKAAGAPSPGLAPGGPPGRSARYDARGPAGAEADPAMIAGYRVVRRLGTGSRADVHLGYARAPSGADVGSDGAGPGAQVALKVFRVDADAASIEREVAALSAVAPGRLAELIDVASLPDGRVCLVLERLSGPALTRRLSEGGPIEPGEAVTILAPVTVALAGLHAAGFGHAGLRPSAILFDARGRPVLAGLGGLRELPAAAAARVDLLREDYVRLARLIREVFDRVDASETLSLRADAVAEWFDTAARTVPFRPCLDELEHRLFDWAPAEPVRLTRTAGGAGVAGVVDVPGVVGAAGMGGMAGMPGVGEAAGAGPAGRPDRLWVAGAWPVPPRLPEPGTDAAPAAALRDGIRRVVNSLLDDRPLERLRAVVRERASGRRRPVVLAGLVAATAVVLGLTFLPAAAPARDIEPAPSDRPTTSGAQGAPGAHPGALEGDDPVPAVPVLLQRREECLAAVSVVCLDEVDQAGSSAMAADSYSVRMAQQLGSRAEAPNYAGHTASLVERTGNSALVALSPPGDAGAQSQPASVLVVKGEAGWRLREIFDY